MQKHALLLLECMFFSYLVYYIDSYYFDAHCRHQFRTKICTMFFPLLFYGKFTVHKRSKLCAMFFPSPIMCHFMPNLGNIFFPSSFFPILVTYVPKIRKIQIYTFPYYSLQMFPDAILHFRLFFPFPCFVTYVPKFRKTTWIWEQIYRKTSILGTNIGKTVIPASSIFAIWEHRNRPIGKTVKLAPTKPWKSPIWEHPKRKNPSIWEHWKSPVVPHKGKLQKSGNIEPGKSDFS